MVSAVSEHLYREKSLPELGVVQFVQFVQGRADGAALPLLVYHSGVPCLPALRCPALENSADVTPFSFIL